MERDPRGPVVIAVVGGRRVAADDQLGRALESGATRLLVDLRESPSPTTRGLNALLRARQRLLARGGSIAVLLSARQRRRFGLLGLDRRFLVAVDGRQAAELLGLVDDRRPAHRARAA